MRHGGWSFGTFGCASATVAAAGSGAAVVSDSGYELSFGEGTAL